MLASGEAVDGEPVCAQEVKLSSQKEVHLAFSVPQGILGVVLRQAKSGDWVPGGCGGEAAAGAVCLPSCSHLRTRLVHT